ncbi:type II toxin-antitoxin system RelE/ParE family toxin [Burkholderia pseudomallei]|uniref:type II toxin-antitoxin system RelE/ParE family toxin n=1 Tax=Burkholderia pseudomallei TaxID=28450 RepID=UPI003132B694
MGWDLLVAWGGIEPPTRGFSRLGNLGQWRAVCDGVNEMKIDVGPGYRAYFVRRGKIIVVVLCGGDKSTQKKDIKLAKQIAGELED